MRLDRTPGQVLAWDLLAQASFKHRSAFCVEDRYGSSTCHVGLVHTPCLPGDNRAARLQGSYGLAQGLAAEVPSTFDGKDFKLRAPEPNAKRGGVLRYGTLSAPAHLMCTNRALLPTWAPRVLCMTT